MAGEGTYLGDVPADGRVIEVLPLVEVRIVLDARGVRAALLTPQIIRGAQTAFRISTDSTATLHPSQTDDDKLDSEQTDTEIPWV